MIDSVLIGKVIYKLLSSNDQLKQYVNKKIYPLIADNDVTYPFIIFYRTSITNNHCKDGYYEDEVSFSVMVVSNKYMESLEIANIVRSIFEKKRLTDEITDCILQDVDEDYRDNAYIQQLYFQCKITN